jgi:pterin-4a-carbinolamine dehydratase
MKQERLSEEAIAEALATLDGWSRSDDGIAIEKRFKFKTFREAFGFMTEGRADRAGRQARDRNGQGGGRAHEELKVRERIPI